MNRMVKFHLTTLEEHAGRIERRVSEDSALVSMNPNYHDYNDAGVILYN